MSRISALVPVYNEEENISSFYRRVIETVSNSRHDFEFIFIDDGSTDNSFPVLKHIADENRNVTIIRLSRNFGSHAACMAGLQYATGDACVLIPADLQDPPELLNRLIDEWEKGCEVVFGVKENVVAHRLLPNIYYYLVQKFALKNMPKTGMELFFIDRKVVNAIKPMIEKNTSILGLILWSGFSQTTVLYKKGPRLRGVSKWTMAKKIKLFIDTFASFSYFPIRMISVLGISLALIGFLYAAVIVLNRILFAAPIEGWSSLMVVVLLVSGIQMMMLGILGEYLWRNFDEARKRPPFIIKEIVESEAKK